LILFCVTGWLDSFKVAAINFAESVKIVGTREKIAGKLQNCRKLTKRAGMQPQAMEMICSNQKPRFPFLCTERNGFHDEDGSSSHWEIQTRLVRTAT
jgi:hypothetical protein